MKPGKVVTAGVLTILIGYGSYSTSEILKLTDRVDELNLNIEVRDIALDKAQVAWQSDLEKLTKATAHNEQLQSEAEHLESKVNALTKQLDTEKQKVQEKQRALDAKAKEVTRLKKQLPVSKRGTTAKATSAVPVKSPGRTVGSNFEVTWYNDYGYTKSGRFVKDGVTVSVDPSVIPLGTWIQLEFPDGTVLKRRADDTGGAVKGNIVDIYASVSTNELFQRGRTHGVKVSIIE